MVPQRFGWARERRKRCRLTRSGRSLRTLARPHNFVLLPTKAGESRPLTNDNINHNTARRCPDGKKFVFSGNEPGHGVRLYVQDVDAGKALAITPEGVNGTAFAVSLDGQPWQR